MELTNLIHIAASVLKITEEEAKAHCKPIPELDAYYFWNENRSGAAVIVGKDERYLGAVSSVPYETHIQAYREGRRNN